LLTPLLLEADSGVLKGHISIAAAALSSTPYRGLVSPWATEVVELRT
jgi:hypothetical protein